MRTRSEPSQAIVVSFRSQMSLVSQDVKLPFYTLPKGRLPNILIFLSLIHLHKQIVKETRLKS